MATSDPAKPVALTPPEQAPGSPTCQARWGAPPGLSIFFPAYNDSGTIASMVVTAMLAARRLTTDYEIIVVNDASTDATAEVLEELACVYDCVRVIHHPRNRGYGGALRSGFAAATKPLIFYTDGDAQYDPQEIALLWDRLTDDVDFVNGYKISRSDPLHRIVIGRLYHHFVKLLFGLRLRDVDCDFRLMRRVIFDRIELHKNSGAICLELMKKVQDAGFRIVEVPVHHFHRAYGKSQFFNVPRIARALGDVLGLWYRLVVRRQRLHVPEHPLTRPSGSLSPSGGEGWGEGGQRPEVGLNPAGRKRGRESFSQPAQPSTPVEKDSRPLFPSEDRRL